MRQGSRYAPLAEHLQVGGKVEVTLSFAEIEELLGGALPISSRKSKAWWSNRDSGVQAAAWLQAGYRVFELDLAGERVTFRKRGTEYPVRRRGSDVVWDQDAIRALREHMRATQSQLAEVLGVRQQTISEWEKGEYTTTRSSATHLTRVARETGFIYGAPEPTPTDENP